MKSAMTMRLSLSTSVYTRVQSAGYAHPLSWTEWGELASSAPIFFRISEGPAPEGLNEAGEWWLELLTQLCRLLPTNQSNNASGYTRTG